MQVFLKINSLQELDTFPAEPHIRLRLRWDNRHQITSKFSRQHFVQTSNTDIINIRHVVSEMKCVDG
jgi:hypothetical protein